MNKRTTVYFDPVLRDKLKYLMYKLDMSMKKIIDQALEEWIDKKEKELGGK